MAFWDMVPDEVDRPWLAKYAGRVERCFKPLLPAPRAWLQFAYVRDGRAGFELCPHDSYLYCFQTTIADLIVSGTR